MSEVIRISIKARIIKRENGIFIAETPCRKFSGGGWSKEKALENLQKDFDLNA